MSESITDEEFAKIREEANDLVTTIAALETISAILEFDKLGDDEERALATWRRRFNNNTVSDLARIMQREIRTVSNFIMSLV